VLEESNRVIVPSPHGGLSTNPWRIIGVLWLNHFISTPAWCHEIHSGFAMENGRTMHAAFPTATRESITQVRLSRHS